MISELSSEDDKFRTKIRRLYDIANVLSAMEVLRKVTLTTTKKTAFKWAGVQGLQSFIKGLEQSPLKLSFLPVMKTPEEEERRKPSQNSSRIGNHKRPKCKGNRSRSSSSSSSSSTKSNIPSCFKATFFSGVDGNTTEFSFEDLNTDSNTSLQQTEKETQKEKEETRVYDIMSTDSAFKKRQKSTKDSFELFENDENIEEFEKFLSFLSTLVKNDEKENWWKEQNSQRETVVRTQWPSKRIHVW